MTERRRPRRCRVSRAGGTRAGEVRPAAPSGDARPAPSRQSVAERTNSVPERESEVASPVVIERLAMARDETRPDVALAAPATAARSAEASETSLDVRAAAPLVPAAAATGDEPPEAGPAALPAVADEASTADTAAPSRLPALKPLHDIPVVVAGATPVPLGRSRRSRHVATTSEPPRPSFKRFELVSTQRTQQLPERNADQEPRGAAPMPETLPGAIQALWTNLKVLLAAVPPSQLRLVGGDDSDREWSGTRAGVASAGDAGRTTGSGSSNGGGGGSSGDGNSATDGSSGPGAGGSGGSTSDSSSGGAGGDKGGKGGGKGGGGGQRRRQRRRQRAELTSCDRLCGPRLTYAPVACSLMIRRSRWRLRLTAKPIEDVAFGLGTLPFIARLVEECMSAEPCPSNYRKISARPPTCCWWSPSCWASSEPASSFWGTVR